MSKPIVIGKYRIKWITYHCLYFGDEQYAVAEKIGGRIGSGKEVCRVSADSEKQAKEDIEKCLNDKFGEGGVWE
ncbi:MAG TPA: hypothetical protein ENI07_04020 [Desulfobacterales bacterium]|nr:hypothetical protein [Desulfobacterales bacterium]